MTTSRENQKFQREDALGDGNCAFNAFILGLCREEMFDGLERQLQKEGKEPGVVLKDFINLAAKSLKVSADWASVKARVLELRKSNKTELQKVLAQAMRVIAVDQSWENNECYQRTKVPLLSAFINHVYRKIGIKLSGVTDDIYSRHQFITDKFDKIYSALKNDYVRKYKNQQEADQSVVQFVKKYNVLKANRSSTQSQTNELNALEKQLDKILKKSRETLLDWWEHDAPDKYSGYTEFLEAMKKDGVWAGDIELAQLANYFHVNIEVKRNSYTHTMHVDHGFLPVKSNGFQLNKDEIIQLIERGIVNQPEGYPQAMSVFQDGSLKLKLLPLNRADVEKRLSAVSNAPAIIDIINKRATNEVVPANWPEECKRQLQVRNIAGIGFENTLCFSENRKQLNDRVLELANKANILKAWDAGHRENPTITLAHTGGVHWSNRLPVNAPELVAAPVSGVSKEATVSREWILKNIRAIEPATNRWEDFVNLAKDRAKQDNLPKDSKEGVDYTISREGESVRVTSRSQKSLDMELAKRVQKKEYDDYLNEKYKESPRRSL